MEWDGMFFGGSDWTQKLLITVAVAALFLLIQKLRSWLADFHCFTTSRARALAAVARVPTADGPREGRGLWVQPTSPPENYLNSFGTRVLVIANNKGGVAKTTLAATLGAYWARDWGKRVLLIDLDYQGTLSSMALGPAEKWAPRGGDSVATRAVSGDLEPSVFVHCAKEVPGEPRLHIIPAYYDLAQADNRLIVEWLLQCARWPRENFLQSLADLILGRQPGRIDVRYHLARLLQSTSVRAAYDIVIIDCPPRFTVGVIQAFCAGTHLLIPTILDKPSGEAVDSFIGEVELLKTKGVCPNLRFIGIVGTLVSSKVDRIAEKRAKVTIQDVLKERNAPTGLLSEEHFVRRNAAFVTDAEDGVAYLTMGDAARRQELRQAIAGLATYVAGQVGLPEPQAFERGEQV